MDKKEELKRKLKELNQEYKKIGSLDPKERAKFGQKINAEKQKILAEMKKLEDEALDEEVDALDITAPSAPNTELPKLLTADHGSKHPLMTELDRVIKIYQDMGFDIVESRQLDDEYHMFDTLNFPPEHPARDGYDTFRTEETAKDGRQFIPPAHTSTMEHRILKDFKYKLEEGGHIAVAIPGRVYRNEDADSTHEHTFYQCEGMYVSETATLGDMIGVLREFFEKYYEQKLEVKTQPGYFPFTEPSVEFLIEKPAVLAGKKGEFLEMLGCGMTHPNVLKMAGIDPNKYRGFAWGGGIDRLAMLRFGLKDVRYFESGKLSFLKEFN